MQGWGAFTGVIIAVVVSYLFFKGTMKVSLKTFFKVTGAFIILIAAGLLVQAISMMQDLEIIGSIIPHLYDLTWFLPEHPIDYDHYLRDQGTAPLLSGDFGIFLKALFGYSSMPFIEEVIAYLGYFAGIYLLTSSRYDDVKQSSKKETKGFEVIVSNQNTYF
jgi:high-affinity iron transporter